MTEYRFVIVSHGGRAQFGTTLGEALGKLFPGFDDDLGDRSSDDPTPAGSDPGAAPSETDPAVLLADADELLQSANQALEEGRSAQVRRPSRGLGVTTKPSSCSKALRPANQPDCSLRHERNVPTTS